MKNAHYEAIHYITSPILLPFSLGLDVRIIILFSNSLNVLPIGRQIKFHSHVKQQDGDERKHIDVLFLST
jgi:hypothetical protein